MEIISGCEIWRRFNFKSWLKAANKLPQAAWPAHDSEAAEPITACFRQTFIDEKKFDCALFTLVQTVIQRRRGLTESLIWNILHRHRNVAINAVISRNCFIAFINFEVWSSNWRLLNVTYLCNQCLSGATRIRDFLRWRKNRNLT